MAALAVYTMCIGLVLSACVFVIKGYGYDHLPVTVPGKSVLYIHNTDATAHGLWTGLVFESRTETLVSSTFASVSEIQEWSSTTRESFVPKPVWSNPGTVGEASVWRRHQVVKELARGYPFRGIVYRQAMGLGNDQISHEWILPGLIANALIYGTTLFALLFAWPVTKHLITRRRTKRGLCTKCRYPRTGLASSAPCPECGTTPATS